MKERRHSKKSWKGVEKFFDRVLAAYAARGINLEITTPFNKNEVGSRFGAEGEAMTDAGRITISVHDWVHMCFDLPKAAVGKVNPFNEHSGKWNFYTDSHAIDNPDWQDDFLRDLEWNLDKINARRWEVTPKHITVEEIATRPIEDWIVDEKMGTLYIIDGFDRGATARSVIEESNKGQKESMIAMHTSWLSRKSDIEVYQAKLSWEKYKTDHPHEFAERDEPRALGM
ncbi:hypothetical protein [Rhizobium sp. MHM7A]|uniref:hypothetical protein n=1 Tax=Rhizobium sp. MHM7A TaxID=2583233 RepID=UPI0011072647|nr:hypothetical protein [Rhizobium sp. MHM7A]TLX16352.1 hypothetical protein FFR93_03200 [Rhizobium sp. MHM7A]